MHRKTDLDEGEDGEDDREQLVARRQIGTEFVGGARGEEAHTGFAFSGEEGHVP